MTLRSNYFTIILVALCVLTNPSLALPPVETTTRVHAPASETKTRVHAPASETKTLKRGKYIGNKITAESLYKAYQEIQRDYQAKAFVAEGWRVLSKTPDVEIAMLKTASDPSCPYVRIKATLPSSVEDTWNFLGLQNWDKTMPKINPFYEGLEIKGEYSHGPVNMTVARKRTKRIFAFGRRDFGLVSVSDVPRHDGVWVSGTVSVVSPQMIPRCRGYVRAFQDSISFYKPTRDRNGRECTDLTMICRTDLNDSAEDGTGGWVPMWVYLKMIGKSGTRAMQGLITLLQNEC